MPNLSKEQQDVVRSIIKDIKTKQIVSFGGSAGCGKTTCITVLSEVLSKFAICAFTGKAAHILRKKGLQASTIHSLIYKPVTGIDGKVEFILKDKFELGIEGFIVDESSMISKDIYQDLLSFNLPVIFVGDHAQLEPIGDNINIMANPMYKLETIHRNAGEIAHFADHIRKGKLPTTFHSKDKVKFIAPSEITDEMLLNTSQMICAFNKTRVSKNNQLRDLKGFTDQLYVGDRVMCLRNNKNLGLFNGMQGEVIKLHSKSKFDINVDGSLFLNIQYLPSQFGKEKPDFEYGKDTPNPFDYAYWISCHKAQGDQFESVLVLEQECTLWEHRRWCYTSASRAIDSVIWVASKKHIPTWL